MKWHRRWIVMACLGILFWGDSVFAERRVYVNGQRLTYPQIAYLEQLHCGPIPNGRYWLNGQTGIWGYAGDPRPQGHISNNCYQRQKERRPSLSERGLLFGPSDYLR